LPEAKIAFILREPRSWSSSVYRTFGEQPANKMVRYLKEGVLAYDELVQSGSSPVLIWYEELDRYPHAVVARLLGRTVSADAIWQAKTADSQANTAIARDAPKTKADDGQVDEFLRLWREVAPVDVIKRHSLEPLLC
jgi:hypothetical protein